MNDIINELLKEITLKERLTTLVIMLDYDNWKDGEYYGKNHKLINPIMKEIKQYLKEKIK